MPNAIAKNVREINDKIGDQGGYFDLVVKPKLQNGHEGELCSMLKEMSLIRSFLRCSNLECGGKNLTWSPARIIDKYTWTCLSCASRTSIRENSFFFGIKCDLRLSLQIMLAWCQGIEVDIVASYLYLKEHIIKKVYEKCALVTEKYIQNHIEEWCLGGPDMIVIIDEFPGGYMGKSAFDITVNKKRNNNSHNILCIAEAKAIPPRMWFHVMKSHNEPVKANKADKIQIRGAAIEEAINEITRLVAPRSFIVANNRARCCNYEALLELKERGYNIVSLEALQKYDCPGKMEILHNFETIWQTGVDICEEVQEATLTMSQQIISSHLWRKRFCSSPSMAFQYLLNHISEIYKFT